LNYFTCKEGAILEEKAIIGRLMELDNRANKISRKKKKTVGRFKTIHQRATFKRLWKIWPEALSHCKRRR